MLYLVIHIQFFTKQGGYSGWVPFLYVSESRKSDKKRRREDSSYICSSWRIDLFEQSIRFLCSFSDMLLHPVKIPLKFTNKIREITGEKLVNHR